MHRPPIPAEAATGNIREKKKKEKNKKEEENGEKEVNGGIERHEPCFKKAPGLPLPGRNLNLTWANTAWHRTYPQ